MPYPERVRHCGGHPWSPYQGWEPFSEGSKRVALSG